MTATGETPEGFIKHAQEFWAAADLVLSKAQGVSLPAFFLLGRSIELSLKAFLLHKGMSIEMLRLREYGHNLKALLQCARDNGLEKIIEIEAMEAGVVDLLSFDYADKRLEYRVTKGTYYLPHLSGTSSIARKLAYELALAKSTEAGA
ncbi:hypothetical protein [Sinimarinibacterium flocculans]|uniref:HEPN domain-containing protein n=1 Tax=Sinimarinibacterium flocculans TaxID=985250 RepID=A0A318EJ08_9GAMM|nr:hypothetical protein C8D93_102467 [Sinimarinibacterium flocculans]